MSISRPVRYHSYGYVSKYSSHQLGRVAAFIGTLIAGVGLVLIIPIVFNNSVGFRLLLVGCFYLSITLGARDRNIFSPFYLFSLVPLSAALYDYRFVPYYLSPLTNETYSLIIYNVLAFLLGLSMFRFRSASSFRDEPLDVGGLKKWTWILLTIGLVPTLYVLAAAPALVLSGRVLEAAVYAQNVPYSWVFGLFKYFAVAMALKTEHKGTIITTISACIISLVLSFNKTQFLFFMMTLFVAVYKYYTRTAAQRRVFRSVAIIGFSLLIYSVVAYDDARQDFDSTANLIKVGASQVLNETLMLPYMYFVSAWNNLQFVMETQPEHTLGAWTIRPILVLVGQSHLLADAYTLTPASSFNTFSFLTIHWKEYGFIGSGIMTFFLALYVSWLFQCFKASNSPVMVAIYGINSVATVEMFFSNHFFGLVYPFAMTLIGLLLRTAIFSGARVKAASVGRST